MNDQRMTFTVTDDAGKEVECEVLFTFESDETKKNYMVYTDNTTDEQGNTKVYASIYEPNQESTVLQPIETEKEWKIIETILSELQAEAREQVAAEGGNNEQA
ncbi:MAG TPA: DUF1292 domain-containing protein [Candidatus Fimihabitans intestinipullorum]|uniref:DUF1292 domain-containing protein n=1 Tax=Candidatus Fimihabitans intestinipullorum TaxID=2840820 RepID=A0A9D1HW11_9BACT|nr:DUF1292 domain-containing protein [Candidatus Fimihabitans intestinipullorum]